MKTESIYHLIVQKILIYPTQIGNILANHDHYIDQQLLTIMQQKARFLSEQGNQQAADFLSSLIKQLQEELILQPEKTLSLIGESFPNHSSQNLTTSKVDSSPHREQRLVISQCPQAKDRYDENLGQEYGWSKWVAGILIILLIIWGGYSTFNLKEFQLLEQEWSSDLGFLK